MKARFAGRCPICNLRIYKGDDITRGVWTREVAERYNFEQQRTEGGYTRTYKYAHSDCSQVMEVENG